MISQRAHWSNGLYQRVPQLCGFLSGADPVPLRHWTSTNHGGFTLCLVHIATLTQCTSLYKSLFDVLQTESTQICSSQETGAYKGIFWREGTPRNYHMMNRLNYTPVAIHFMCLWWSPTASEVVYISTFSWGSMPPDPPCTCTDNCMLHMPHQSLHYAPPPFTNHGIHSCFWPVITLVADKWIQKWQWLTRRG